MLSNAEASQYDLLEALQAYKHPELIERYKRKLVLTEADADQLFSDVKKYLYLVAATGEKLAPTAPIDAGWHEFLMYTRDYAAFSNRFFGTFIHHTPEPTLGPRLVVMTAATIAIAERTFGTLSAFWGDSSESDCAPDSSCHGDDSCGGDV